METFVVLTLTKFDRIFIYYQSAIKELLYPILSLKCNRTITYITFSKSTTKHLEIFRGKIEVIQSTYVENLYMCHISIQKF